MSDTTQLVTQISDAELDQVGAASGRHHHHHHHTNVVGAFVAVQGNASSQNSFNLLSAFSGNQAVFQSNNASIG